MAEVIVLLSYTLLSIHKMHEKGAKQRYKTSVYLRKCIIKHEKVLSWDNVYKLSRLALLKSRRNVKFYHNLNSA